MHLLNYLGHFPLGRGATQLTSSVHELSDISEEPGEEGKFSANNVQV
jgi:hypothetical protein